jgi:hypothetical protein
MIESQQPLGSSDGPKEPEKLSVDDERIDALLDLAVREALVAQEVAHDRLARQPLASELFVELVEGLHRRDGEAKPSAELGPSSGFRIRCEAAVLGQRDELSTDTAGGDAIAA